MLTTRRKFLEGGAISSASVLLSPAARATGNFDPRPGAWRKFQVTTHLAIAATRGAAQAWIPVPGVDESEWFKSLDTGWTTEGQATRVRAPKYGADIVHVRWADGDSHRVVEVTSAFATRDRAIDLANPRQPAELSAAEYAINTQGTEFIPVDGIVKQTSDAIVSSAGAVTDLEKARAIYEWVVEHTYRDASVRGCGEGDVVAMLRSADLGGKCADINALYVGLVRAARVPARDVYGIRVAPSQFGYRSLGANAPVVTKAQHCRAEVYLSGFGWVPADPADVRKVVLEEPPTHLAMDDPKVRAARRTLFGSWETNWLAYNFAHDVALPGSEGPRLPFLMYPQAEIAGERCDCYDADNLKYTIVTKEIS
jgi:transglutaminase-like putative cysteine protease